MRKSVCVRVCVGVYKCQRGKTHVCTLRNNSYEKKFVPQKKTNKRKTRNWLRARGNEKLLLKSGAGTRRWLLYGEEGNANKRVLNAKGKDRIRCCEISDCISLIHTNFMTKKLLHTHTHTHMWACFIHEKGLLNALRPTTAYKKDLAKTICTSLTVLLVEKKKKN